MTDDIYSMTKAGFHEAIRQAKEESWDEGYDRAESDHEGTGFWTKRLRGNPYRKGKS